MKKIINLIFVLFLMINLYACNNNQINNKDHKISIVTTIFPIYDWTREIIKGNEDIELRYLLDNGLDLHNYQASAKDIIDIGNCDLFIYVGGESDTWVDDALKEATNKNMKQLNLVELLGEDALIEELKEGMNIEEEEEEEEAIDEHVFLSIKNAIKYISIIKDEIIKLDKDNKDLYEKNSSDYINKLNELDNKYNEILSKSKNKILIFADRFPFRYLIEDYHLDYYAAFLGCSAETEASFETILFLTNKLNELNLKHILVLESSDQKIAKTIIDNSNIKDCEIEVIDSIQSTILKDNKTYISIMENNLEVLKRSLN